MRNLSLFTCLLMTMACSGPETEWTELFNGEDLSGWSVMGTDATFEVGEQEVIGTNQGRQNTFLATDQVFCDFILELEVWADPRMNSGIQFRSAQNESGRVYGYQAEIDPSPRAYSGGIYDEARRDWLYPLSLNPDGQKAFKLGDWNKYRIEALGTSVRVWVNDICTAVLEDDVSLSGFIALQVHGVGKKEEEGRQAKWRNVRILTEYIEDHLKPLPENGYRLNLVQGLLTDEEQKSGWKMLAGETVFRAEDLANETREKETAAGGDTEIKVEKGKGLGRVDARGYELSFLFKVGESAEGQLVYLADERYHGQPYQLTDPRKYPREEATKRPGALTDKIAPQNLSYAGMGERYLRSAGQWNHGRIIVKDGQVEHWMNGFKIVEYTLTPEEAARGGQLVLVQKAGDLELKSLKVLEY